MCTCRVDYFSGLFPGPQFVYRHSWSTVLPLARASVCVWRHFDEIGSSCQPLIAQSQRSERRCHGSEPSIRGREALPTAGSALPWLRVCSRCDGVCRPPCACWCKMGRSCWCKTVTATTTTVTAVGGGDGDGCGRQLGLVGDHRAWLLLQDGYGYSNDSDGSRLRQRR